MKAAALRGALSDRLCVYDRIHVVEAIATGDAPSAKAAGGKPLAGSV